MAKRRARRSLVKKVGLYFHGVGEEVLVRANRIKPDDVAIGEFTGKTLNLKEVKRRLGNEFNGEKLCISMETIEDMVAVTRSVVMTLRRLKTRR